MVRDDCDRGSQKEYAIARSKSRQALNRTSQTLADMGWKDIRKWLSHNWNADAEGKVAWAKDEDPSLVS